MYDHCDRPGICDGGHLGCNCGCYICDGGPKQGLSLTEWRQKIKNKIRHFEKLLAAGIFEENGYPISQQLWLTKIMLPKEEYDLIFSEED